MMEFDANMMKVSSNIGSARNNKDGVVHNSAEIIRKILSAHNNRSSRSLASKFSSDDSDSSSPSRLRSKSKSKSP
jgi:hypothetical protein